MIIVVEIVAIVKLKVVAFIVIYTNKHSNSNGGKHSSNRNSNSSNCNTGQFACCCNL